MNRITNGDYDKFLSFSSFLSAFYYGGFGALLLIALEILSVSDRTLYSVLAIYGIAAIAHMNAYGFQAVNVQTKVCADYMVEELRKREPSP